MWDISAVQIAHSINLNLALIPTIQAVLYTFNTIFMSI